MTKEDEIRRIAYNIWEQEGCRKGINCEDWIKAESIWELRQKFVVRQRKRLHCFSKEGINSYLRRESIPRNN